MRHRGSPGLSMGLPAFVAAISLTVPAWGSPFAARQNTAANTPTTSGGQDHSHAASEGAIPAELLTRPIALRQGIGPFHESVSTSSREAQAFYDQGTAFLHSYVWIQAARSFNQALRLDRRLSMAALGLSYAYSGLGLNKEALAECQTAKTMGGGSKLERLRIEIRLKQLAASENPQDASRFDDYKKSIDDALADFPSDVELWLLRGNAEEPTPAGIGQRGTEGSIKYYQRALALDPDNFAAHHYLTHSYENIGRINEALEQGREYAKLAPMVPHAHHMYGHDLRRVGRTEEAIAEFERAYKLEIDSYGAEGIPVYYDWHHEHNLDLLAACYQYVGRMKDAERLMRESFALPAFQENLEFNKKEWPSFLLDRGRPAEALEAARTLSESKWPAVSSIGQIMASHALMALGRMREASAEAKTALARVAKSPDLTATLGPYLEILQGEFYLRTGQAEKGRAMLERTEDRITAAPGPDAWSQSLFTLERIARIAWDAGDWPLAKFTGTMMEEHDPYYAGAHYAMAMVAEHDGQPGIAMKEFEAAGNYWAHADPGLPELKTTRARIVALQAGPGDAQHSRRP